MRTESANVLNVNLTQLVIISISTSDLAESIEVLWPFAKSYRKTKTKEKATRELQFLSDLKGVPITEHIRIILFHFKILKLKSQEESKDGKELIR